MFSQSAKSLGAIAFPRKLPRRPPTFLAVYRGQPEAEAALVDLKGFAAPAVIVHFPATLRPAAGIGHQPVSAVLLIFISWTFYVVLRIKPLLHTSP